MKNVIIDSIKCNKSVDEIIKSMKSFVKRYGDYFDDCSTDIEYLFGLRLDDFLNWVQVKSKMGFIHQDDYRFEYIPHATKEALERCNIPFFMKDGKVDIVSSHYYWARKMANENDNIIRVEVIGIEEKTLYAELKDDKPFIDYLRDNFSYNERDEKLLSFEDALKELHRINDSNNKQKKNDKIRSFEEALEELRSIGDSNNYQKKNVDNTDCHKIKLPSSSKGDVIHITIQFKKE